jgi:group I intron endonuclease
MEHLLGLRSNILLQRSIIKHGIQSFSFVVLEFCAIDQLIEREQYYINALSPEFNILKIAGSSLGFTHSEETKSKMSGESHPQFGKERSDEDKSKISQGKKGYVTPEEVKNQISNKLKGINSGANNPFYGKTHSEETLQAMSDSLSGSNHYMFGQVAHNAQSCYLYSVDNTLIQSFDSKTDLAAYLKVSRGTVRKFIKSGEVFNKQYLLRETIIK